MKKILVLFIAVIMVISFVSCGGVKTPVTNESDVTTSPISTSTNTTASTLPTTQSTTKPTTSTTVSTSKPIITEPSDKFDPENIVLSFGALSDIHINASSKDSENKFRAALSLLQGEASKDDKDGLDVISIAGDIADTGKTSEIQYFKKIFEASGTDCDLILTLGNHDDTLSERLTIQKYYDVLGEEYFKSDIDMSDFSNGSRHCVVNGYHFVFVEPIAYDSTVIYDDRTLEWLDKTLEKIATEDPDSYIFFFTHPMIYMTCYGSDLGPRWYTKELTPILDKYPQIITFSGHLHFPINDERSIMQTNFTSVGCGSVRYLAIEGGYANASGTVPVNAYNISSGLLVQVDESGNVRITRMNFSEKTTFKDAWELPSPKADKSHLTVYTSDRKNDNSAPVMEGKAEISLTTAGTNTNATLKFDAGTDDDFVHHYIIDLIDAETGRVANHISLLSDFYLHATNDKMENEITVSLGTVTPGKNFIIEITAVDSWDAKSNKLKYEFSSGEAAEISAVLPPTYADLVFSDGKITDMNNKLTVSIVGAKVAPTELSFAGKTKTVNALNISAAGQYALVKFNDYNATNITNFYNSEKGYSVEGLYINRAPSSSQGIICGTQEGGWGIATSEGAPYLYTYIGTSNAQVRTTTNPSKTELTHIVATFIYAPAENKTYTTLFINGSISGSQSQNGKIKVSTSTAAANAFCLGADIDRGGTGSDFQMTNFSISSVKIYAEALNYKQVETAYSNAVKSFE